MNELKNWTASGRFSVRCAKHVYAYLILANIVFAALAALALATAACAITWGVLARNIFAQSTTWELEAGIYLILYATFFGAAYTHLAGGQIGINILKQVLSTRWQRVQKILVDAAVLLLFGLICYSGGHDFWTAFDRGWHSETIWGPPLWIPLLSIPIGAALLSITLATEIILTVVDHEPPRVLKSLYGLH